MPDHTLFPEILPEGDFVDDSYSRSELDSMGWDELRGVAKEHPTEEVDGRSDRETIIETLTGRQRI